MQRWSIPFLFFSVHSMTIPLELTRSYRPLLSLPIAFGSLSFILLISSAILYSHTDWIKPGVTTNSRRVPSVVDDVWLSSDELDLFLSNHTLFRRLDPYSCTKEIPCHTKACYKYRLFFRAAWLPIATDKTKAVHSSTTLEPVGSETPFAALTASANVMRSQNVDNTLILRARLVHWIFAVASMVSVARRTTTVHLQGLSKQLRHPIHTSR